MDALNVKLCSLGKFYCVLCRTTYKWLEVSIILIDTYLVYFHQNVLCVMFVTIYNNIVFFLGKYKRLTSQNSSEPNNRSRGSIKKYCTEKVSIALYIVVFVIVKFVLKNLFLLVALILFFCFWLLHLLFAFSCIVIVTI